jgi:hypothetical protein
MVLVVLNSCGPAIPVSPSPTSPPPGEPQAQVNRQPDLAMKLGMRLSHGETNSKLQNSLGVYGPTSDLSAVLGFEKGVQHSGDRISYPRVFQVPRVSEIHHNHAQELFFVWPEEALDSKILAVSVIHQILNGKNEWISESDSVRAWHDSDGKRYFVRIAEMLYGADYYKKNVLSDVETQRLKLSFLLQSSSNVQIEVNFRVKEKE